MPTRIATVVSVIALFSSAFALTSGPSQPEFASFEPADASDLVNLPTGDFSYVLPLGKVNTPDGTGYPIVLSYHGGIQNEQEATWVGLGWSLNVGSINRSVRMLPDDYNGYGVLSHMSKEGESGWNLNVGVGWGPISASVGFSCKSNGGVTFEGLSSMSIGFPAGPLSIGVTGYKGGMSAGANMSFGSVSMGAGISVSGNGNVSGSVNAGMRANGHSVAGFSLSSSGQAGVTVAGQSMPMSQSMTKEGMHQFSNNYSFSLPIPGYFSVSLGFQEWGWYYSFTHTEQSNGYLFHSKAMQPHVNGGSKALCQAMSQNYMDYDYKNTDGSYNPSFDNYYGNQKAEASPMGKYIMPSQDIYSLTGQGISSTFMPMSYQPTVSAFSENEKWNGLIGFTPMNPKGRDDLWFVKDGLFNKSTAVISTGFDKGMAFKSLDELSSNMIDNYTGYTVPGGDGTTNGLYSDYASYSNIGSRDAATNELKTPYCGKRIIPLFGLTGMRALNGFAVTDGEGKTYYYTKALYSIYQTTYFNSAPEPPELIVGNKDECYKGNVSYRRLTHPYATSWLLTAITGPDYVKMVSVDDDPESSLMPHDGDYGYWVRFNYSYGLPVKEDPSTHLPTTEWPKDDVERPEFDKAQYGWRMPYWDSWTCRRGPYPHQENPFAENKDDMKYSSMFGIKEMTYLKSIETPSEIAFFRTSERFDGYGLDIKDFKELGYEHEQYDGKVKIPYETSRPEKDGKIHVKIHPFKKLADYPSNSSMKLDFDEDYRIWNEYCDYVDINKAEVPLIASSFDDAAQGDELCRIKLKYDHILRPRSGVEYYFLGGDIRTVETIFRVIKDNSGCTVYENGDLELTATLGEGLIRRFGGNERVSAVKCFHAKDFGGFIRLYFIAYQGAENGSDDIPYTETYERVATDYWKFDADYSDDEDPCRHDPEILPSTRNGLYFLNRDKYCRWAKKLDEIAWYSKTEYPYVNDANDPQNPLFRNNIFWNDHPEYPFPASYRRMKFKYNYELAKGTPNSRSEGFSKYSSSTISKNAGRLTLKELYEQCGPETDPIDMPSYFFDYQGKDILYADNSKGEEKKAFTFTDPWGFRCKTPNKVHPNSVYRDQKQVGQEGVQWNLERITLPSCGKIEISYERDRAKSSWLTLADMNREYTTLPGPKERDPKKSTLYYPGPLKSGALSIESDGLYTPKVEVEISDENPKTATLNVKSGEPLHVLKLGMLAIVEYEGEKTNPDNDRVSYLNQARYLYRISIVDAANNQITLDRPLEFPEELESDNPDDWYTVKIVGIYKKSDICDGLRVTKIQTSSISGVATTVYSYPKDGVIETAPGDAFPPFLKVDWKKDIPLNPNTYIAFDPNDESAPIAWFGWGYGEEVSSYTSSRYLLSPDGSHYYQGFRSISYSSVSHNFTPGKGMLFNLPQCDPQIEELSGSEVHIVYLMDDDGPSAKRDVAISGKMNGVEQEILLEGVEFAPTLLPGKVGDVKLALTEPFLITGMKLSSTQMTFIPSEHSDDYNLCIYYGATSCGDIKIIGIYKKGISHRKEERKYSPIYTSGNTSVIYPEVEVQQTNPDGENFTGKTRYTYFHFDDLVPVNGSKQPLISSTVEEKDDMSIWKIIDRSSMAGLAKSIEQIRVDDEGNETVVGKTEKHYAFGEELDQTGIGVLASPSNRIPASQQPLGLIRERALRIDFEEDVDVCNPAKLPSTVSDVIKSKPFLVSVIDKSDGASKKTSFGLFDIFTGNALATLVTGESSSGTVTRLDVNVPYRHLLGSDQSDILDEMKDKNIYSLPGGTYVSDNNGKKTIPDNIANDATGDKEHIFSANFTDYVLNGTCLVPRTTYSWKGGSSAYFEWPLTSTTGWRTNSILDLVDRYSRPLQESLPGNAAGTLTSCVIHHPTAPVILASIQNADYGQCAVFTCDYDQSIGTETDGVFTRTWFDEVNGWKATPGEYADDLQIVPLSENTYPQLHFGKKALKISGGAGLSKTLSLSEGTFDDDCIFSAWVYSLDSDNGLNVEFTYGTNSFIKSKSDMEVGKWQIVRLPVSKSELAGTDKLTITITVSGDGLYMDDIRFRPKGSHMTTFYYDYSFNKPVAIVGPNDNAKYFKYDYFGRLVEKGVIKDTK